MGGEGEGEGEEERERERERDRARNRERERGRDRDRGRQRNSSPAFTASSVLSCTDLGSNSPSVFSSVPLAFGSVHGAHVLYWQEGSKHVR